MPKSELISHMAIKIGGKDAPAAMMHDLNEIVVDTSLHLPDMFTIEINDDSLEWMDSSLLDIGSSVEISAKAAGESAATGILTKGEITAIEPEFPENGGTSVIIRGYDKSHRLHRGKKTRTFKEMSDSEIVKKIAQECGLTAKVEKTKASYEHIFQDYQTDMEFVQDIARRVGYFAYVADGTLHFCSKPDNGGGTVSLEWGQNLVEFQSRYTTSGQVAEAAIHGWDPKEKQAIIGKSKSPRNTPKVDGQSHGGDKANKAFSMTGVEEVLNNRPVRSQGEADVLAQAVLDERCHDFFHGEGTCRGNPAVRAGAEVELKGIGKRFSGRYRITRATHRYDIQGYTTQFEISGYRANTLSQLLGGNGNSGYGVVVGIVTNAKDPEGLARVKVKYPTISDQLESHWARLATPMAGSGRGFEFIPEVNDEVLVAFEYNDINRPYILGSLWNGKDKPPEASNEIASDGKVKRRIIHSRSGHTIALDDTDGDEKISIVDKTGNNSIEIDSTKNTLTIKTDGAISMETKDDVTIKGKNITLDATADAKMTAKSNINLEATLKATVKGKSGADVQADGPVNVKSTATTNVEGSLTNVKASTALTIQGTPVKIN
ncbi:MAG TPA: VgrG-related protein [Dehalococcoidia bacterium]|nr:VgrG-related protein [Dehalococcoidia bacterium]